MNKKIKVFNLFLIDASGSMAHRAKVALSALNENLQSLNALSKKVGDTQDHFVSVLSFESDNFTYIYHNTPINQVDLISKHQYVIGGCTPLYDAMGMTLTDLEKNVEFVDDAQCLVTVITDGYENCSTRFSNKDIQRLCGKLREKGWVINYLGTDQDVEAVADSIGVGNRACFENTEDGWEKTIKLDGNFRAQYCMSVDASIREEPMLTEEERKERNKELGAALFEETFK